MMDFCWVFDTNHKSMERRAFLDFFFFPVKIKDAMQNRLNVTLKLLDYN